MTTMSHATTPDFEAIKSRQKATWGSGNYGQIGSRLQIVGESLCAAADVRAHHRVLDVAAGTGNASLAAARRFADVVATDYVPELLDQTRRRAAADGLALETRVADCEQLPFADGEFDVTLSTYGVMFAPNQERSAAELVRVTKPGGRIAMANWTPESYIGEVFRIVGRFVPPPAGVAPASAWGTEARLRELFDGAARELKIERKHFHFVFRSPEHWVELFRTYYGPVLKAFGALDAAGQAELHAALVEALERRNVAGSESLVVPSEYLEIVIERA